MKTKKVKPLSASEVFGAISDGKSIRLFNMLATENGRSDDLIIKLGISRKEYYSRISKLVDTGMIRRIGGEYTLTVFGRILYEAQLMLAKAVNEHLKLKTMDSVRSLMEIPVDDFRLFEIPVNSCVR